MIAPATILAVDPGLTCGWAVCETHAPVETFRAGELAATVIAPATRLWLASSDPPEPVLVVVERYMITRRTVRATRQPDALEVIGQLREVARTASVDFRLQMAAAAKTFVPNHRLRSLDLDPGSANPHARDAARHLLLALAETCRVFPGV